MAAVSFAPEEEAVCQSQRRTDFTRERVIEGPGNDRESVTGRLEQSSFAIVIISSNIVNAEDLFMFGWALTFLIIALVAGILGFGGVAIISIEMAKIIFTVAIILFLVSVIIALVRGRSAPMA
jgi:uncharacterized membrane protein YtjA (UPF0391 family)